MNDSTRVWKFGKFIAVQYPDVYFQFVSTLHREYPELLRAMEFAQVKMEDGTAIDFLNMILDTKISKEMAMELGYAILLDALNMRSRTIITGREAMDKAARTFSELYAGYSRNPEDQGKPLFPSVEEMEDKGMKPS